MLRRALPAAARQPVRDAGHQLADLAEIHLGVDAIKVHLRSLYRRMGIETLPQNEKRARLAELAFHRGLISQRDLDP